MCWYYCKYRYFGWHFYRTAGVKAPSTLSNSGVALYRLRGVMRPWFICWFWSYIQIVCLFTYLLTCIGKSYCFVCVIYSFICVHSFLNFISIGDSKCSFGALSVLLMHCTLYTYYLFYSWANKYMIWYDDMKPVKRILVVHDAARTISHKVYGEADITEITEAAIIMMLTSGAAIPIGQGGHVPQYLWRGDIHGNVPPNILEVMSFGMSTRVTATVVCCILTQILCVVSQKSFTPGPCWGTSIPQTPSLLLCPQ